MTEAVVSTPNNKSRKPLIIMLVVSLLPMMGAYLVYFTGFMLPENTVNAGQFISPAHSLESLVSKQEWESIKQDKKWRMLLPVSENCNEACSANLYTSRQVHIRLDQKSKRLERMALISSKLDDEARTKLQEDHPRLRFLSTSLEQAQPWLEQMNIPATTALDYYLLVDQEGRAMMVYDQAQHGNEVLKDLKRAIKFSIDYQ